MALAYFPGNLLVGTATKHQGGVLVIPWLKRNILSCGKGRCYANSLPVRYIPKKSSKGKENNAVYLRGKEERSEVDLRKSSGQRYHMDTESKNHTLLRNVNKNHEVQAEMRGDFTTMDDECVEEPDGSLESSTKIGQGIQNGKRKHDAEKTVIGLLAVRTFTAMELKKKLETKRFPLEIIDSVLTDFQNRGLVNDGLYAETFSRSRWSSSSWGPRRIKQALYKKGVSQVDADNAIKLVFSEGEEEEDLNVGVHMSKLSMDQLYVQVLKQWNRSENAPNETRKSRIVRWLQYRGFNWSVVKYVLNKLESS